MKKYEAKLTFYADNMHHALYITKFIEVIEMEIAEVKDNGKNKTGHNESLKKK